MAKSSDIVIRTAEYRQCIVKGKHAFFHRWITFAHVVDASRSVGGSPGGQIMHTLGLVEIEDGTMLEVLPEDIRFLDSRAKFKECFWPKVKAIEEAGGKV